MRVFNPAAILKQVTSHCPSAFVHRGVIVLAWLGICLAGLSAAGSIPDRPQAGDFLQDLATLLDEEDARKIQELQQQTFAECGIPIVVVTINWMTDYDPGSPSIELFARRWFDTWGIGSQEKNEGMLVIVSRGDREARIELGAEWGRRFDGFCKRLMDRKMVPEFKEGDYGAGLIAAVSSLSEVARRGAHAAPPDPGLTERILNHPFMVFNQEHNPVAQKGGPILVILMIVAAVCCFVAAGFLPDYRKLLVIAGIVLVVVAALLWIVVPLLVIWAMIRGNRGGGGSGGGGGGGGFGGGSSGGGGASGGW